MMNTDDDFLVSPRFKRSFKKHWLIFICVFLLVVGILIGYGIAYGVHKKSSNSPPTADHNTGGKNIEYKKFHDMIVSEISNKNIEENLRTLTKKSHIAGGKNSYTVVQSIANKWRDFGIDDVKIKQYNVLLSKPIRSGFFTITNTTKGVLMYKSHLNESTLIPSEEDEMRAPPFNAYSKSGVVKGSLVYINFGTLDDFLHLQQDNINLTGKIALARYGKGFRGNKVELAANAGAIGIILFSDPQNYAGSSHGDGSTFPGSWWLPSDGTQRGSIKIPKGDPLTPGYPAVDGIYRLNENEAGLPTIPCHPVSYSDGLELLKIMDGKVAPEKWQGGLNITYKLTSSEEIEITLNVSVVNTPNTPIYNVIGKIPGSVEPDRIVALGNHHDAWVFGGVDPSSATAVLLEIVRSMALAVKKGWKPRRTILFCNWDAEEYGMIGSNEWVEEYRSMISTQMVAYLNVDCAIISNYTFFASSSAQIIDTLYDATKQVEDPSGEGSIFDVWSNRMPDQNNRGFPKYSLPNARTDFEAFFAKMGVPSYSLGYSFDWNTTPNLALYPVYHSVHDNFYFVKNFLDKDFKYSASLGKVWSLTATRLADSIVLPFNFKKYAQRLDFCKDEIFDKCNSFFNSKQAIEYEKIVQAVKNFSTVAESFVDRMVKVDVRNELSVRMLNDKLMAVERAFLSPNGLPNRPSVKRVVYGYSRYNTYLGSCMPALVDDVQEKKYGTSDLDKEHLDERILQDISQIYYHILQAASVLDVDIS